MAVSRFFCFVSVTALASGLFISTLPAVAEGGGADRESVQEFLQGAARAQEQPAQALSAGETPALQADRAVPLPPRRPADLEASFAALQPVASQSGDQAAIAQPDPAPPVVTAQPVPLQTPAPMPAAPPVTVTAAPQADQPTPVIPSSHPVAVPLLPSASSAAAEQPGKPAPAPLYVAPLSPMSAQGAMSGMGFNTAVAPVAADRFSQPSALQDTGTSPKTPVDKAEPQTVASAQASPPGVSVGSISVTPSQAAAQPVATAEVHADAAPEPLLVAVPMPPRRPHSLQLASAALRLPSSTDAPVQSDAPDDDTSALLTPGVRGMSRLNRIIGDNPTGANNLRSLISKYASANGIPFGVADAVVRIESRYNPMARNGPYMGLMQIHPRTAASLGYGGDARGLLEADTNLQYGIKYLGMAYHLARGDICGTVMRYQSGHRAVSMTAANRTYCNKVKMILAEGRH